jgi:sugar phosphate isomerase/epimerase
LAAVKLSFWTLGTPDWTNEQVADAARRYGFDGVDLRCAAGRNVSLESTPDELAALQELFASRGVEMASLLAYNERGNAEGVDWAAVTADLVAHARLANRMGVRNLRINATEPAHDSTWDAYLEGFANAIQKTLAESTGLTLNMQNHPGSLTVAQVVRLAEMVGDPRFGAGLSPDHCIDMGEDVIEATKLVAPHVRQLHLADRERTAGGKLRACLPGAGFVPNSEVLDLVSAAGFDGWVSFKWEKPTYPDLPDADVALPHFMRWVGEHG